MRKCSYMLIVVLLLGAMPALSQQGAGSPKPAARAKGGAKNAVPAAQQDEGEKKFEQNCHRCHNAPESISPRIAGTIVRHMRVRASLSQKDAEEILRFLNP